MYEISIERVFCAAHALVIGGAREPTHGHNWRVRVAIGGTRLDDDGLLVDFHALESWLDDVLAPLRDADLNATPPFDAINPSAELVARHVADRLVERLRAEDEDGPRVHSVSVTEAPGCQATYRPPR